MPVTTMQHCLILIAKYCNSKQLMPNVYNINTSSWLKFTINELGCRVTLVQMPCTSNSMLACTKIRNKLTGNSTSKYMFKSD
jgi:hypothetical protein